VDIELLRTFLEVRKTRHFGGAAENLHLTQAAVSARIRQLEQLLGVKLFTRSRNNIQLTSEGERLVAHAQTVLQAWSRARQELALETGQSRRIHIGIRSGLWNTALQQRLQQLHEKMPELALHTQAHLPDATIRMLLDRTLDISISYDPPNLPEFRIREIGEVNLQLYSRDRRASAESALADAYVYIDWGSAFARFHAKRFGEVVLPVLRTNVAESALGFILENGGAAYLPVTLAESGGRRLYLVDEAPAYTRKLHAAYRLASDRLSLIDAVLDVFEGLKI
jgi:DNA-binding transcriptional LysR family regulator